MKGKLKEILLSICVSYTILNVSNSAVSLMNGYEFTPNSNSLNMILWTSIAVLTLYAHHLFDKVSPLVMIICQYVFAMSCVLLIVYVQSLTEEMHPNGYRDVFLSFTIPFIIGGFIYYYQVYKHAKKDNALLKEIQSKS